MSAPVQAEVGPLYDLLLATRDGTTLPCRNKDGATVNVSQVAFMTSIDPQHPQHEETELQHKDQLVQFASSNLIDREFDQWPQITQGDWSGGTLQRVLTGGTPLTSFGPQSDPTRYWDGLGMLWPISDYLPQQPILATADQSEGGNPMVADGPSGTVAGTLVGAGTAFVYEYMQNNAPQNNIIVIQSAGVKTTIVNPPGSAAGSLDACDLMIAFGYLWRLYDAAANLLTLDYYDGTGTRTNALTIAASTMPQFNGRAYISMAAARVGEKRLLAFSYIDNATNGARVALVDFTASTFNTITTLQFQSGAIGITPNSAIQQLEFSGSSLIAVVGPNGYNEQSIVQYDIPSATFSTLARFGAGIITLYLCSIQGNLFVIAADNEGASGFPGSADLYLLQGGTLQHIGPLQITAPAQGGNVITGFSSPTAFGPYAIFAVLYTPSNARTTTRVTVFAYDVSRGRLFRLIDLGPFSRFLGNAYGRRLGVFGSMSHPFGGGTLNAQWGIALGVLSGLLAEPSATNVQRLLMSASSQAYAPFLQQGVQITSSVIDFTSAAPKLIRQLVATWAQPGLPSDAAITVQLDAWLDQDPSALATVPDFTTGAVATGVNGGVLGQTKLTLPVNKIARKVVYRITTVGPSTTPTGAIKLVSVIVQAAVGWTRTMFLDLADDAMTNSKGAGDYCWTHQQPVGQPPLDGTAAYNFLRQLWRLKGGEVTATFPNGDAPADWLLQDAHWDSPKPFGVSFRSDKRSGLAYICQLKMREDI